MRGLATVTLLIGLAAARVAGADALGDALKRLQERYESTRTYRANFQQVVESPTLAGKLESRGRVAFEKPNRMRWDYDPPDEQTIVGDGETLWLYQPDMKQVIKSTLGEAFRASTPVTFLSGLGHVDREFEATLERNEDGHWVLKLVPRQDRNLGTIVLTVRKSDGAVEEARVTDTLGTSTRISFSGEQRNVPLEPALFHFTPPPGVDVVRPPAS